MYELLALLGCYREFEANWTEVLMDLKQCGLKDAPKLAAGDCVLGLLRAVAKLWHSSLWKQHSKMVPIERLQSAARCRLRY